MPPKAIEIIALPGGDPPEHIQEAWKGIVLPILETDEELNPIGALSGQPDKEYQGYAVNIYQAILALRKAGRDEAADWWFDWHVHMGVLMDLVFKKEACREIEELPKGFEFPSDSAAAAMVFGMILSFAESYDVPEVIEADDLPYFFFEDDEMGGDDEEWNGNWDDGDEDSEVPF